MTPATARRIPAPFSVLTALAALALSAPLALVGAPGHAAPLADDSDTQFKITADIVINKDDTYSAKMVIVDNTDIGFMSEDNCSDDMFAGQDLGKNAKATFKDNGDSRTCTIEGSQSIKDSKGQVKHEGNEYIVKTGSESTSAAMSEVDVTQTITFPGKVTEADGGKVEGNKVTFTDIDAHTVKGGDGSIPMWVWIVVGAGALALIGGLTLFFVIRSKKNKTQTPYGTPVQGYDPNQAFPAQQPGYGAPQAQPGYGAPGQQAGYGAPQAQPGQQPGYGAPGQGTY